MGFITSLFILLLRFIHFVLNPFMFNFPENEKKSVSPTTDDLLRISATKLSELIRQRKVSCEDVIRAYIKRIKEVNHLINAVVEERFEDALKEAKSVDDYLRTTSLTENELQKIKPLLGVPVTIKESCMLSGMSFAVGCVLRKGIKADNDGDAVIRVKMSGAIPLLVSTTPELCMSFCCQNNITGTTCNPYDITRNSGASSGGEGALLGAGGSLIGLGSDLLGSIRLPAMCCGVFGHKPTPRIVPLKGHMPLPTDKKINDYLVIGPMTRYAEDLKLFMTVLSGKQGSELKLQQKVDMSKLRVYSMEGYASPLYRSVETEIKDAINKSVSFLEENCSTKTVTDNTDITECFQNNFDIITSSLLLLEGLPNLLKSSNQNAIIELMKSYLGNSKFSSGYLQIAASFELKNIICDRKHNEIREELRKKLMKELGVDGVLLFPTFISPAPYHKEVMLKYPEVVIYLGFFNILGFPATQVPCGKSHNGLPIGLQVIAAPNQDRLCFAVAEELEKCFGGWIPPNKAL